MLQGKEGRPDVTLPDGPPPSKLVVVDLKKGSGRRAEPGSKISVRYFSFAFGSHKILEDSWKGAPTSFTVGGGQVSAAWEKGLLGIKAGGRRELVLPSKMTFAKAPEISVIDALSVGAPTRSGELEAGTSMVSVKGTGPKPKLRYPSKPPRHVVVRVLKEGSGRAVTPGEQLAARYVGGNPKTKLVQDFWSEENPYRFTLGKNTLGKAWVVGMKGMKLGGRRELIVPSRLAYGNGMMVYVIELLAMEKQKPNGAG